MFSLERLEGIYFLENVNIDLSRKVKDCKSFTGVARLKSLGSSKKKCFILFHKMNLAKYLNKKMR